MKLVAPFVPAERESLEVGICLVLTNQLPGEGESVSTLHIWFYSVLGEYLYPSGGMFVPRDGAGNMG